MVKIFVQNKPLFLVDKIDGQVEEYIYRAETIFIDDLNASAVKTMLQQLTAADFYAGVFLHHDVDKLLHAFKARFKVIQAAGGLVCTHKNEFLLIFRKGKWDLPKGKLDEDEDLETCALREIEEETGAKGLEIEKPLQVTYHTYYEGDAHILKESHWFLVRSKKRSVLKPQIEEDIEKCEWVPVDNLTTYINNMHASIIDVIKNALELLNLKSN